MLADEKGNITAIVTDVGLPDGRGDDLARQAREDYPDLPVVIITGYGDNALRERLSKDTGITLLTKPFYPEQVVEALRKLGVPQPTLN
jgi:FixJ family two-component response regulator